MNVTIWTDASIKDGQMGYAFIAEAAPGHYMRYTGGGADIFGDINATEAFAIDVAVDLVVKAWPACDTVEVFTDSQVVANAHNDGSSPSVFIRQSVSDAVKNVRHRGLTVTWLPRRSTERMREVDDMAKAALRSSK